MQAVEYKCRMQYVDSRMEKREEGRENREQRIRNREKRIEQRIGIGKGTGIELNRTERNRTE